MDEELGGLTPEEAGAVVFDMGSVERLDPVNLQMLLVTSSMNHEYTRKACEKSQSFERKQELLSRMANLRTLYFTARKRLAESHPERLESLERELFLQKQVVLADTGLH